MKTNYENENTFESNRYNLFNRRKGLKSLYDSPKWENGKYRVRGEGRKSRNKNHRGND